MWRLEARPDKAVLLARFGPPLAATVHWCFRYDRRFEWMVRQARRSSGYQLIADAAGIDSSIPMGLGVRAGNPRSQRVAGETAPRVCKRPGTQAPTWKDLRHFPTDD